jgi:hypothetical protein
MTDKERIYLGLTEAKIALLSRIVAECEKPHTKPISTSHYIKTINAHLHIETENEGDTLNVNVRMSGKYPKSLLDEWMQKVAA